MGESNIKLYLGLDESNNNGNNGNRLSPEIRVLAYTGKKEYAPQIKGSRLIKGKKRIETLDEILRSEPVDFLFMLLYDDCTKRLGITYQLTPNPVKYALIIHTFLSSMQKNGQLNGDYDLFVDGTPGRIGLIKGFLSKSGFRKPAFKEDGDEHILIVNIADRIANCFYKDLVVQGRTGPGSLTHEYWERRAYLTISDFAVEFFQEEGILNIPRMRR